ncbi:SPFH domain-containing protein [Thomasclavelia cocleata]|uniref:SPFH domain-containing protein n=1 Tax=Thomasclavelia cocleata TaxID=69824 RepID=UPI00242EC5FE|nr:SPFH domain-containing protein [Thomasclavelia cocleata]
MAIIDVIKYEGSPDVFAWKHPDSELGTWTQLIVNESQEVILVKGGHICDVFGAGRHTLATANIPILNKLVNLPFGGRSPFTAEIWYINKLFSLDVKWGTSTPIQLQDPKYNVFVPVRAFGQFGIQIENSKKFLLKLVGTLPQFDKTTIIKFFRGVYLTKAKDAISTYLVHKNISILEINAYLDEISSYLQEQISPMFGDYGIKLVSFFVNDINVPEDDSAVAQLKKALAKRAEMDIVGYSYQQERSFDTLEEAVSNPSSMQGGLMGAGIGLGMGVGVGNTIGQQFNGLTQNLNTSPSKECPKCKARIGLNERFCNHCGYDTTTPKQEEPKVNTDNIICSACNAKLTTTTKFCPECGKKYNPCSKCKADLPEGATNCTSCGTKVPETCPQCGRLLEENSKFCPECGYSLIKKCKNCGTQLSKNAKFCPECGTPID